MATYIQRGMAYAGMGDYANATSDLNKAVLIGGDIAFPYNSRGIFYLEKGAAELALIDFQRAITIEPCSVYAYKNLAKTYFELGEWELSKKAAMTATGLNLDDWVAYTALGNAHFALGNNVFAIDYIKEALVINPYYGEAHYALSIIYHAIGLHHNAKWHCDEAAHAFRG
jgi:tetratricopeptide (TPR) repeat protein